MCKACGSCMPINDTQKHEKECTANKKEKEKHKSNKFDYVSADRVSNGKLLEVESPSELSVKEKKNHHKHGDWSNEKGKENPIKEEEEAAQEEKRKRKEEKRKRKEKEAAEAAAAEEEKRKKEEAAEAAAEEKRKKKEEKRKRKEEEAAKEAAAEEERRKEEEVAAEEKRKRKEERKKRKEEEAAAQAAEEEKRKRKEEKKKRKEEAAAKESAIEEKKEGSLEGNDTVGSGNKMEDQIMYICMVCGKSLSDDDCVNHLTTCTVPKSFRGERFIRIGDDQMTTKPKKEEKVVETSEDDVEEPREVEKKKSKMNLNMLVKSASKNFSSLLGKEEDDENPEFICMVCNRKLSTANLQNHSKHCKVPAGFGGSQFMVLNSDKIIVEKKDDIPEEPELKEETPIEKEETKEDEDLNVDEIPVISADVEEEEKPKSPNPFDDESEKEEKPKSPNPFDNESEEGEKRETEKESEKEEIEETSEDDVEEPREVEKKKSKMNLNMLVKSASKSFSFLRKEEDDENPEFICMVCNRKLSTANLQNHSKHCKVPAGFGGSQFMVLNSDKIIVEKKDDIPEEPELKEETPIEKEETKEDEDLNVDEIPVISADVEEEEKPKSPNPFDDESEKEEKPKSPNPFDNESEEGEKRETEKESEKEEDAKYALPLPPMMKLKSPNPFDDDSEEELKMITPNETEMKPKSPNPFDEDSEEEISINPRAQKNEDEEEIDPLQSIPRPKKRFGLNSFLDRASRSFSSLLQNDEEDDKNAKYQCTICDKKLAPENLQNHLKRCKVPADFVGSQFIVLDNQEGEEGEEKEPVGELESPKKGRNLFTSFTSSISNKMNNLMSSQLLGESEEGRKRREQKAEEERLRREEEMRKRREEEERIMKQREEEERKKREEEERRRKKAMIEDKLKEGIVCKKHCSRIKPHPTTISLITVSSGGRALQWIRKKSFFHPKTGTVLLSSLQKIVDSPETTQVTLMGSRDYTFEFESKEQKNMFFTCFPLICEGITAI